MVGVNLKKVLLRIVRNIGWRRSQTPFQITHTHTFHLIQSMAAAAPASTFAHPKEVTKEVIDQLHIEDPKKGGRGQTIQVIRANINAKKGLVTWFPSDAPLVWDIQGPTDNDSNPLPMDSQGVYIGWKGKVEVSDPDMKRMFADITETVQTKIDAKGPKWYPKCYVGKKAPGVSVRDIASAAIKEDTKGPIIKPKRDAEGNEVPYEEGEEVQYETYSPKYTLKMMFRNLGQNAKGAPRTHRFAGVLDDKTGELVQTAAYLTDEKQIHPQPIDDFRETKFFVIPKVGMSDQEIADTAQYFLPLLDSKKNAMRCAKTGRIMCQYVTPFMLKKGMRLTVQADVGLVTVIQDKAYIQVRAKKLYFVEGSGSTSEDAVQEVRGVVQSKPISAEERIRMAQAMTKADEESKEEAGSAKAGGGGSGGSSGEASAAIGTKRARDDGDDSGDAREQSGKVRRTRGGKARAVEEEGAEIPEG